MATALMKRIVLAVAGFLPGVAAEAQNFDVAGNWNCSVVLYTTDGRQPFGFQAEVSAQPNGSLFAIGAVYDPNLMSSVVPFQAGGDWGVFQDGNGLFVRLRALTQTHGILVFEGYATSATTIDWVAPLDTGGQSESQCTRIG